ncbi:hypothetical protein PG993_012492 [Apiospora rasikravindrae]|uniref:Amine oxidase domain-containing protein n=1 Tax=Apiospora rasikravindrae TaxID=990691 RepID=A0ABR1S4D7_9PEZI
MSPVGMADKRNIHLNKAVNHIKQSDAGAKVHNEDGQLFEGDVVVVVGNDSIHCKTLREMRRIMGNPIVNGIAQSERKITSYWLSTLPLSPSSRLAVLIDMPVSFSCVFGISHDVSELQPGEQILRMSHGSAIFVMGSTGVVLGFIVTQLDRRYEDELPNNEAKYLVLTSFPLPQPDGNKKLTYGEIDALLRRFNKEHLPRASTIVESSRLAIQVNAQVQEVLSKFLATL